MLPVFDKLVVVELEGWDVWITFVDVVDIAALLPHDISIKVEAIIKQVATKHNLLFNYFIQRHRLENLFNLVS